MCSTAPVNVPVSSTTTGCHTSSQWLQHATPAAKRLRFTQIEFCTFGMTLTTSGDYLREWRQLVGLDIAAVGMQPDVWGKITGHRRM